MRPLLHSILKLSSLCVFFASTIHADATHMVGGDLHYECLGNNEYLVVLTVYRDCQQSSTPFDDPACIAIYDEDGNLVQNLQISLADAEIINLPVITGSPCFIAPADLCIERCRYSQTVTLPPIAGGYDISYQRCCRNTELVNCDSFDNLGMTLIAQIPDPGLAVCNSNPAFNQYPPVVICLGQNFVFDHGATDIDGDSLVYEFCNPLDDNADGFYICPPGAPSYPDIIFNGDYTYTYPIDSDPAFAIDANTGLLTGTPTELGKYVVGICVSEYRNGQLISTTNRDFQFNIMLCEQNILAEIDAPEGCQGLSFDFTNASLGDTFSWDFGVEGIESDTSDLYEPSYTYDEPGIYTVQLIANPGFQCADTATVTALASPPIVPEIIASGPDCVGGSWQYVFNGSGNLVVGESFEWTFESGDPDEFSGIDPGIVNFETGGDHVVNFTVTNGICTGEDSMLAEIPPIVNANALADQLGCVGLIVDFTNQSSDATTYEWHFGDGFMSDELNPQHTYTEAGTYTITLIATGNTECSGADTMIFDVDVILPTDIEALFDVIQIGECNELTVQTLNESLGMNLEYHWNFGDGNASTEENPEHTYTQPGIYTITLTISNPECDTGDNATMQVELEDVGDLELPPFAFMCYYDPGVELSAATGPDISAYTWSTGETTSSIYVTEPGEYEVMVTFSGCTYTHTIGVSEGPETPVTLTVEFCEGSSVAIHPDDYSDEYSWCTGEPDSVIVADAAGEYCFMFIDTLGCLQHGTISVELNGYAASLYVPNAFTPDNDGLNDVFQPVGTGIYEYSMKIFNRWGEKVFETDDFKQPWVGSYKSGEYYDPDGVYVYIITYRGECAAETIRRSGFVVMTR